MSYFGLDRSTNFYMKFGVCRSYQYTENHCDGYLLLLLCHSPAEERVRLKQSFHHILLKYSNGKKCKKNKFIYLNLLIDSLYDLKNSKCF